MRNWKKWKRKYREEIKHIAGYEETFVDRVLCRVPELTPDDVIPQYHFIDDSGGNRYIDFMIINRSKGYCLPIELDGTYKDVDHHKWKDFLVRQNSLVTKFGVVLRFSNKQMFEEPNLVIAKISQTLNAQHLVELDSQTKETGSKSKLFFVATVMLCIPLYLKFGFTTDSEVYVKAESGLNKNTQSSYIGEELKIKAREAPFHVGKKVIACGKVTQVYKGGKRNYLNLDGYFPNQPLSILIWGNKLRYFEQAFGDIEDLKGLTVCARGEVSEYKGDIQIQAFSPKFLNIKKS